MSEDETQPTPQQPGEPRVLGGRYEVGPLIGRGGMAEVHRGHDLRLGRPVAIKILRTDLARDTSFLARFRREAQAAAGLNHPSIVSVYDSGEQEITETGGAGVLVPYIVMEMVEGRTLRDVLNDERVLDPDEAARVTAAVLAALGYAHERHLVHRDIKPANVMLTRGGAVKVMDFGIARALADTAATMTQTQAVLGTARYLSPEQAQGEDVDARSDLYSVGCLFYELLTGRTPFLGDPVSLVYQHLGEEPKAPSTYQHDVPQVMDAVALHALQKAPDGRYQSAEAFRDDLAAARSGAPLSSAAQRTMERRLGAAAAGAAGAAALGAGAAGAAAGEPTEMIAKHGGSSAASAAPPQEELERTDEIPVREQRHGGGYVVLGVLALLALAGVGWVVFQLLGPGNQTAAAQVPVPMVTQISQEEAEQRLQDDGFVPDAETVKSTEEEGTVVGQNPSPGTELDRGSTVTIEVSEGPDAIAVPDVVGDAEAVARRRLEMEGLTVAADVVQENSPQQEKDTVISTDPEAGQEVDPARAEVVLTVASGRVEVPDVRGQDRADALVTLREQSCLDPSFTQEESDEAEPGVVIEQSLDEGEEVDCGTEIMVTVAEALPQTVTQTREETITQTRTVTQDPPEPPEPTGPTETDSPTTTDEPTETDTPTTTDEPTETDTPTTTDEPTETDTPTTTDEPTPTGKPTGTPTKTQPVEPTD